MFVSNLLLFLFDESFLLLCLHHGPIVWVLVGQSYVFEAPDSIMLTPVQNFWVRHRGLKF